MTTIRARRPTLLVDDETWTALEAKAADRRETPGETIAYALERYLDEEGFTPAWALTPLDVRFPVSPSSGSRRRAR